jgi:hypothetical protein
LLPGTPLLSHSSLLITPSLRCSIAHLPAPSETVSPSPALTLLE